MSVPDSLGLGAAEGDEPVEIERLSFALRREVGRHRRAVAPRRDALDLLQRPRQVERREEPHRIARRRAPLLEAAGDRLQRRDRMAAPLQLVMRRTATKVLPMSVPVAATKTALMGSPVKCGGG